MSETVTRAAMNEDLELLLSFFPNNWQDLAAETGVLHGLRKTVVRARKANLADLSDIALLNRLRKSRGWLFA